MCVDVLARDRSLHPTTMHTFEECPSFLNHIFTSDLFENFTSRLLPL